jgi:hypothetical protein
MFRSNTVVTDAFTYRAKYIDYLMRNWSAEMSGDSMMKVGYVRELRKINNEYWNRRTDESTKTFRFSEDVIEGVDETPATRSIMRPNGTLAQVSSKSFSIGLKGGRFQLRR